MAGDLTNCSGGSVLRDRGPRGEVSHLPETWLLFVSGVILLNWGLSAVGFLRCSWIVATLWVLVLGALFLAKVKTYPRNKFFCSAGTVVFGFVATAILASLVIYPPTTHDSLSYRIPRILLWLQEGSVRHLPVTDERINFMTHNWELLALPLFQGTGDRFLELPGFICWILLYIILHSWAKCWFGSDVKARWIALIGVTPIGFVLQAASTMNDLMAGFFIIASLLFLVRWEEHRVSQQIVLSGLALAVAAGTKPHYSVLAVPWLLWFFASSSRPWRSFPWKWAPLIAPLVAVVSPAPAFFLNAQTYGSWFGPAENALSEGSWWAKVLAASAMFLWQAIQLPLNPVARQWNSLADRWVSETGFRHLVPKLNFDVLELPLVESASFGIVAVMVLGAGMAFACRKAWSRGGEVSPPVWTICAATAGLFGFLVAGSQVVPSTIGRAFMGFALLGLPLCLWGLGTLSPRLLRISGSTMAIVALGALIVTPSHPLWPVDLVRTVAERLRAPSAATAQLERYDTFVERYYAGRELVEMIPPGVDKIGVLTGGGEPLLQLWQPYEMERHITLFPPGTEASDVSDAGLEFVVATGIAREGHGDLVEKLLSSGTFRLIAERSYVARLQRGLEKWQLLEISKERQ